MNVYDSARMADVLAALGYVSVDAPEDADMVILNTCHIREKAAEKVYSELGRLRALKEARAKRGKRMVLAVAGCVAQAQGDEIIRRAPFVDMVFGPQVYHRLGEMAARISRAAGSEIDTEFPAEPKFDHLPEIKASGPSAFITVQEGCDRFCTFCVVPYTRGAEYSRPAVDVLAEAAGLARHGVLEITFLGQNVNAYRGEAEMGESWGLARLISEAAKISGIERIRYTTSYPAEMDDDLIAAHGRVEKLMPFLHLPVQSGSAKILKAMNRRHDADDYRRLVEKLRRARPDIALSSDFIVGFPGETDDDFKATLKLVEETGFAHSYSFKYSPRPGTPAAVLDGQVEDALKSERLFELQALLDRQRLAFNLSCQGRVMAVLFERRGRRPGQLVGRSPYMQPVHASLTDDFLGTITEMRITDGFANSLQGASPENAPETERLTA